MVVANQVALPSSMAEETGAEALVTDLDEKKGSDMIYAARTGDLD